MRQNPFVWLILKNWTKTSTTAPAHRRVCGLSTSMKNNNTPQRKGERWHNHNYSKTRRKKEHHGTRALRRCLQGGKWCQNVTIVSQAWSLARLSPESCAEGNRTDWGVTWQEVTTILLFWKTYGRPHRVPPCCMNLQSQENFHWSMNVLHPISILIIFNGQKGGWSMSCPKSILYR